MEKYMSNLRNNVKMIRQRLQFSQEKLASLSGLSQQTINNIENGEAGVKTSSLLSIAKAFDIHPQYLLADQIPSILPIHTYGVEPVKNVVYKPTEDSPSIAYLLHDDKAFFDGYQKKHYCLYLPYTYPVWSPFFGYLDEYGIRAVQNDNTQDIILTCLNVSAYEEAVKLLAETFTNNGVALCHSLDILQDMKRGMPPFTTL